MTEELRENIARIIDDPHSWQEPDGYWHYETTLGQVDRIFQMFRESGWAELDPDQGGPKWMLTADRFRLKQERWRKVKQWSNADDKRQTSP